MVFPSFCGCDMLTQTHDFAEEVQVLAALLRQMDRAHWSQPTQFKQWTPDQILRHLHCWNEAADWACMHPRLFRSDSTAAVNMSGVGGTCVNSSETWSITDCP